MDELKELKAMFFDCLREIELRQAQLNEIKLKIADAEKKAQEKI